MSDFGPLMISLASTRLGEDERALLDDPRVGGILLFAHNYRNREQLFQLTDAIRAVDEHLIIAVDHEGGPVQRFQSHGFTHLPAAALFGRLYDHDPLRALALVRSAGALAATELRQCGIDLGLAPVLDLAAAKSRVIGRRAFHADPVAVAALGAAFVHGLHDGGMPAVCKHYPGHGSVADDTHSEKVVDPRPEKQIRENDMFPYVELNRQGLLDAVMMAHVVYPQVDDLPASLSSVWMQDSLGRLGFNGIIFSDDVAMKGLDRQLVSAQSMLTAGCHVILASAGERLQQLWDDLAAYAIDGHRDELKRRWNAKRHNLTAATEREHDFEQTKFALRELTENRL